MLSLKPRPFIQSSFDIYIYAGVPIAKRVFFFLLFIWRCRFSEYFFVPFPLSLCMESTSYVLSFRVMVLFYLVTTDWIFDISLLYENSINQSNYSRRLLCRGVGQVICRRDEKILGDFCLE